MMGNQQKSLTSLFIPLAAVVILAVVVAWLSGAFSKKISPGSDQEISQSFLQSQLEKTSIDNSSLIVKPTLLPSFEPVSASIEAKHNVRIASRILARVEKINVSAGDVVEKGQVLVTLERGDLASRLQQSKANLQSLEARYVEARNRLSRSKELFAKRLISDAQYDSAKASYDSVLASKKNAEQRVLEANTALSYAVVKSPIAGVVVDRLVEPGDTVQPANTLLNIYNPNSVRVEANVRESLAVKLNVGDKLVAEIPSLNRSVEAIIDEMVPAGNSASRSFLVKANLKDSSGLLSGMYAKLLIPIESRRKILIPSDYIAKVGQLHTVIVESEGQLIRRFIRIGKQYSDTLIEVVSGLDEGDVLRLQSK